jgi:hypothetical protein
MPSLYADDDAFETVYINGKPQKILRDGHKVTIPTRLRDAARSGRGPVTDAYGRVKFHQPGYRFLDIGDRDAAAEKRQAYLDYQTETENAWRNPAGDVGSRIFTDQREGDNGHAGHLHHGADGNASVNDARDTAYSDYITNAWPPSLHECERPGRWWSAWLRDSLKHTIPTSVAFRWPQDHASRNFVTNGLRISRRSTWGT